ncbi:MSMEG_0568 family radical SAM protein [Agarilytica rhodophyticola]|uniref:MSMEG_0568 family radical SAM protein n=1 Tax=Agarilytica rhodophyticola TaxID=1737490 RepID=UPI000B349A35|nr:MSMEG_0568 family radical SAM protein [Agarilytica rhodophyticola]
MLSKEKITALQAQGLRWVDDSSMGLNRRGGAGPTDHKALSFDKQTSMIPVFNEQVEDSPFSAQVVTDNTAALYEKGTFLTEVSLPARPKFYDLKTQEGIPYSHIATLHSKDVLATTVLQTCVRYRSRETSCQFCAIEESLKNGSTIARKDPEQIAEVTKAAVELDGVSQLIMTTGTPKTSDRGAEILARCAKAVKRQVNIPIQAQCEPPAEDYWFTRLKNAGVDALGMHLEAVSDRVRKAIMPGKASVPLTRYFSAYKKAVEVFGAGNVSTYILAGLGDTEEEIITISQALIDIGVYPFVVPFVPVAGTPLENHPMPNPEMLTRIFSRLGPAIKARGIQSDTLKAGCAKCGACSALKSYE